MKNIQILGYPDLTINLKCRHIFRAETRVMFQACRPVARRCEHGHVVGVGDDECEEGHQAVGEQSPEPRGLLGQIMDVMRSEIIFM